VFIGHFAIGLGAKKVVPQVNLGILFIACQLLDFVWPVLVLLGIERVSVDYTATAVTPLNFEHYPYSHSLLMTLVYCFCAGVFGGMALKSLRVGVVIGVVTASHWLLDFITHRPDLPLWLGGEKVGLGLWNHSALAVGVEVAIFSLGVFMYLKSKAHMSLTKKKWFYGLVVFLLVVYSGNIWGPKPPMEAPAAMIAGPALAMWLFVLWGYLVDKRAGTS
jgi:hypothetical protein